MGSFVIIPHRPGQFIFELPEVLRIVVPQVGVLDGAIYSLGIRIFIGGLTHAVSDLVMSRKFPELFTVVLPSSV